jgi:hypothetical protein
MKNKRREKSAPRGRVCLSKLKAYCETATLSIQMLKSGA